LIRLPQPSKKTPIKPPYLGVLIGKYRVTTNNKAIKKPANTRLTGYKGTS